MVNKILIRVMVPSLGKKFEIFISERQKLHQTIPLIAQAVEKYSEGEYRSSKKEVLCTSREGNILDINYSAYELGLHNGQTLILI